MGGGFLDFEVFPLVEDLAVLCKGNPGKGLFVAANQQDGQPAKEFLGKVLQAVGFDLENEVLTFWSDGGAHFRFQQLKQNASITHAIFFGFLPKDACLNLAYLPYQPIRLGGTVFLFADSLGKIMENPSLKRPLWEALKKVWPGT